MQLSLTKIEGGARWIAGTIALLVVVAYLVYPHAVRFLREQSKPVVVLGAGTRVLLDGVPIRISGFDECPRNEGLAAVVAGDVGASTMRGCIALGGDTAKVHYFASGQVKEEVLTVIHDADRTSLRRANGSPVIATAH